MGLLGSQPSILVKWFHISNGTLPPLTVACWVSICVWGGGTIDGGMVGYVFDWLTSIQGLGVDSVGELDAEVGASMI